MSTMASKFRASTSGKSVLAASLLLLTCCLCNTAVASPEAGWWWNPAESGRGFFIESQGGIIYLAGYFYADDGRARWLVAGGPNADPYHYQGRLLEYHGGQTLFGAYVPPTAPLDAGAIAVDFADDTHGTITWPGGSVPIEREIFDATDTVFQPETGWYWNPLESGSGYSVEVQGNNLFLVGFMYDAGGNPVWYFSAGPLSSPTTYSGSLLQFAGGQTLTGPYHPPGTPVTVGNLSLAFTAPNAATMTFTGSGTETAATKDETKAGSRQISIQREFQVTPHPYSFPKGYSGRVVQLFDEHFTDDVGSNVSIVTRTTVTGLTWGVASLDAPTPTDFTGTSHQTYEPSGGTVSVTVAYASSNALIPSQCTGTGTQTFAFQDLDSNLIVSNLGEYRLTVGMAAENLSVKVPLTCTIQGHVVPGVPYTSHTAIRLMSGTLILRSPSFAGSLGPVEESATTTRSGSWFFSEQR